MASARTRLFLVALIASVAWAYLAPTRVAGPVEGGNPAVQPASRSSDGVTARSATVCGLIEPAVRRWTISSSEARTLDASNSPVAYACTTCVADDGCARIQMMWSVGTRRLVRLFVTRAPLDPRSLSRVNPRESLDGWWSALRPYAVDPQARVFDTRSEGDGATCTSEWDLPGSLKCQVTVETVTGQLICFSTRRPLSGAGPTRGASSPQND